MHALRELYPVKSVGRLLSRFPSLAQFVKFCVVGCTNLALDFGVYFCLTRFLRVYYLLATVLSFLVAVTWSFFINRRWTFDHSGGDLGALYAKFLTANTASIAMNTGLLYMFVEKAGLHDLAGKLISSSIVAFFNFAVNKFWTFRKRA